MKKIKKIFYENGNVKQQYEVNEDGEKDGYFKQFHENGQLRAEVSFTNDIQNPGTIVSYHENGIKAREVILSENGNFNGNFIEWYENGNIKIEGYYKNDEIFINKEFNQDGTVKEKQSSLKGKNINSEFDYRNIKFTDDIEKITEVLSSDNKYTFYFKFTEYFDKGCLVQLETLEESNKVISEWDDDYYDEFEWDEPKERGVGGTEDEFDNTKEFFQVGDVECVNLYRVKPEGFRESFLNLVRKFKDNNPSYLQELIDLSVDGEQRDSDPGCYEEEFLYDSLEIDYYDILNHQYLTGYWDKSDGNDGYKVTFLRYCQGNIGGEQFEFGYIKKQNAKSK